MNSHFKNKTVIISGGSEGIGAAVARRCADAGANLVLLARNADNLERIAEELRAKTQVHTVAMDVADYDACVKVLADAEQKFGAIHVLVNNAGYHQRGPVEKVAAADLGRMIDVNLKAPIILSRLALPYLRKAGGGAIVNVASLAGRAPVAGAATYSASKFGLRAFSFALGEELTGSAIKVAVVSPGPIATGFILSNLDAVADITFSQPFSSADEVAEAILALATNEKRERCVPRISGVVTTVSYVFPWLGRLLAPVLRRKGRKVKARMKSSRQ